MMRRPECWLRQWKAGKSVLSHATAVDALTDYFVALRQAGSQLYFLTLTYKESTDHPLTLATISRGVDDIYVGMLCRYVHRLNFARPKYHPLQPIMLVFPDRSQSKFKLAARTSHDIVGLHHHAIVAARPEVAARLDLSCVPNSLTCLSRHILTSDIRRIDSTEGDVRRVVDYATSYAFKKLPKADEDNRMLVYPAVERWRAAPTPHATGAGQHRENREACPSQRSLVRQHPPRSMSHGSSRDAHRARLLASCIDVSPISAAWAAARV